jgi:glucose/arabinose dehydrogenase
LGFGDGSPYCLTERCQRTGIVEPFTTAAYAPFDLNSLSGKILRIDPETGRGVPDNPFYDPNAPRRISSMILARGVRTPFRIQVDRKTGEILVGDVGTDQWEEINNVPVSWSDPQTELNFGWPCYEGGDGEPQPVRKDDPYCVSNYYDAEKELTTPPWFAYPIEEGAALILGPRYRRSTYPSEYVGKLFFGDWRRDGFWTLSEEGMKQFGKAGDWGRPVDIEVSPRGNVAYLAIGTERLNEIVYIGGEMSEGGSFNARLWISLAVGLGVLLVLVAGYRATYRRRARPSR